MNRRAFVSRALMATALVALTASSVYAASPSKTLKPGPGGPKAPSGFAAPGGGNKPNAEYEHDSKEQLDVWVARCNDAGGGMELGRDGNYRCVDSQGKDIEDW